MSDRIEISATEAGVVRVFDVDLSPQDLTDFNRRNGSWPLREALDAEMLDADHVDLIRIDDLEGVGLAGYLEDGMGVSAEDIAESRAALDRLTGTVLVVGSRAFGGTAQVLRPRAPLHLVATFTEERAPVSFDALPDESAQRPPDAKKKPPSDAAMSGRVAMIALLVLFALTAVVVWVAS
ncbi:hypothetical protein [Roseovarius aestuariivivens]|uniref:hypothetical protein n=1 Tax=Roseovarius aestuariivivens TaxID=1888910 RepID=UPI00108189B4|nr:hypothetical protein [Roseovarius aestuariivivens]